MGTIEKETNLRQGPPPLVKPQPRNSSNRKAYIVLAFGAIVAILLILAIIHGDVAPKTLLTILKIVLMPFGFIQELL